MAMDDPLAQHLRRREFLQAGAAGALGVAVAGCGVGNQAGSGDEKATTRIVEAKPDGDLILFNWSEYLDPKLVKGFEQQYGVKVRQSFFDSMEGMMAKLRAGNVYDLIFPTADYVDRLVRSNALLQLDKDKLENAGNVFGFFEDPWYDAQSAHTVPYAMYTTGIAWRDDKVSSMTGSWNDLTNADGKGRAFLLDDYKEGIGQANLLNGFDLNTADQGELDRSKATLLEQRGFLRGFSTNDVQNLLSGQAWIHHAWNGDVVNVRNQAKNPEVFKYQTCTEGIPVGSDCMAIPAAAKHPGTALLFIDWILDPGHASQNIGYFGYPMPIKGAEQAFADLVKQDAAIEITLDDLEKGSQFRNQDREEKKAWDRVWTEVKAA
jgi:spermidine/putrescine transport system substrate-binding protein